MITRLGTLHVPWEWGENATRSDVLIENADRVAAQVRCARPRFYNNNNIMYYP